MLEVQSKKKKLHPKIVNKSFQIKEMCEFSVGRKINFDMQNFCRDKYFKLVERVGMEPTDLSFAVATAIQMTLIGAIQNRKNSWCVTIVTS